MNRLRCHRCEAEREPDPDAPGRCDCGGVLSPERAAFSQGQRPVPAVAALDGVDGVPSEVGDTSTHSLPGTADRHGASSLVVKQEGANPAGSVRDRSAAAGVAAARAAGYDGVVTAAAGDAGVAVAAYAARAGLEASVYLPSRARFDAKAAVNVHGGDMTVVRGRLADARGAAADADGRDVAAFASPWAHDALVGVGAEIGEVDHVVAPASDGALVLGLDAGLPERVAIHAVQPSGCAPIVAGLERVGDEPELDPAVDAVEAPDTVVGELEDPDPPGGRAAVAALRDRDGDAVAVSDDEALDVGLAIARRDGWLPSLAGAVALAGCEHIGERIAGGSVAVVDPGFGRLDADGFRSRLMARGE